MGTYSDWLNYITDPSEVDMEVFQALSALDVVIDELYQAEYIRFSYDQFFSSNVTTVGEALRQLADSQAVIGRQLITIPDYGVAFTDNTPICQIIAHRDGVPGLGQVYLRDAPTIAPADPGAGLTVDPSVSACVLQVMQNGSTVYTFGFGVGEHGPKELDFSFLKLVKGDIIALFCAVAGGAGGLAISMEI